MPIYLDLAVLIVVLMSGLLALLRGFTREVLAILSWVVAAAAAYFFHPLVTPYFKPYVQKEEIALAGAVAAVFFIALVLVSIVTVKLSDAILDSKIGALDRTLGFLFGAVRGALLAIVAFLFYSWLVPPANQQDWIKNARTKPFLEAGGETLRQMLPENIDSIVDRVKAKKQAPANEEPPAEPAPEKSAAPTPPERPAEAEPALEPPASEEKPAEQ